MIIYFMFLCDYILVWECAPVNEYKLGIKFSKILLVTIRQNDKNSQYSSFDIYEITMYDFIIKREKAMLSLIFIVEQ